MRALGFAHVRERRPRRLEIRIEELQIAVACVANCPERYLELVCYGGHLGSGLFFSALCGPPSGQCRVWRLGPGDLVGQLPGSARSWDAKFRVAVRIQRAHSKRP